MKRFALIGRRLGHSYSQRWFEEMFVREGLKDYHYGLVEMPSLEGLREWVKREGINGFNVTVPYKQEIVPLLDELDDVAAAIGAVNCVTVENGRLMGHNTDAPAFRDTLKPFIQSSNQAIGQSFILGTGGAARAVAYGLEELGIPYTFVSRHPEQHENAIGYDNLSIVNHQSSILINATPVGMYPDIDAMPIPDNFQFLILTSSTQLGFEKANAFAFCSSLAAPNFQFVYDLIYNPSPTRLLREAAARGAKTKDGLEMLYLQAELSWKWFREGLGVGCASGLSHPCPSQEGMADAGILQTTV